MVDQILGLIACGFIFYAIIRLFFYLDDLMGAFFAWLGDGWDALLDAVARQSRALWRWLSPS